MPKTKTSLSASKFLRTTRIIQADDTGKLPTEIEVLRTGMWETPWHGDFMITPQDLSDYVQNFNNDVRPNSSTVGLPIDQDHDAGAAAGWMKKLYTQSNEEGGLSLWASVEWTPLGQELLSGKIYSMFSPEFCPEGYYDPEGEDDPCDNVLIGGGLTNRPLFKDLQPIVASEAGKSAGKDDFNKIFLSASAKGDQMPTLEEVRVKEVADLSEDERKILEDNKDQLSADEQVKFGFKEAHQEPVVEKKEEPAPAPAEPVAASEGDKVVTISASEKKKLEDQAAMGVLAHEKLVKQEARDHVREIALSASDGFKVKADMEEALVGFYVSASDEQKEVMDKVLSEAKPIMASSEMGPKGSDEESKSQSAYKALRDKAEDIVKASEGKTPFSQALVEAMNADPELSKQYSEELAVEAGARQ